VPFAAHFLVKKQENELQGTKLNVLRPAWSFSFWERSGLFFLADTLQETGHRSRGDQEDNGVDLEFIDSGKDSPCSFA